MRLPLLGGAYQSRSLLASAQRCVNLYPELNPKSGSPPVPITHYPTPGLRVISTAPNIEKVRTLYRTTSGQLFAVVGPTVYFISESFVWTVVGTIPYALTSASMADNGLVILLVDGSSTGYAIDLVSHTFAAVTDPNFYGALKVDYLDGYFILNRPDTTQFYISLSNITYAMLTGIVGEIYSGLLESGGAGYTNGSYSNVPLTGNQISSRGEDYTNGTYAAVALTGGSGTGKQATILISGGKVRQVTVTAEGTGYQANDILSVDPTSVGGTGGGFVYFIGSAGTGATVDLIISGNVVTSATLNAGGVGYANNDILETTSASIGLTGAIVTSEIQAAGTAYTNGVYPGVALTGGDGYGAVATVTVAGTVVTTVAITAVGAGYSLNDVLSVDAASVGGTGSGFQYLVTAVVGGFVYSVTNVHGQAFDPLDIAAKSGSADNLVTLAAIHGELWLIGELTSEIWANTGAADFTFGRIQGAFIDHGCVAPYSLSQQDISLFWLAQDRQGKGVIVKTNGYSVDRISTYAIEQDIQSYAKIDDAIGYCYQQQGHAFYVLTFPSESRTWVYEMATGLWHERASIDGNGVLQRNRTNCFAYAYGRDLAGDYQNGSLYLIDPDYYLDANTAIPRIRTFPHVINDGKRVRYDRFSADIEVGQAPGTVTSDPPQIFLRWSDTRGATFGDAVAQSLGSAGQFYTQPQWRRLGIARDRVFELSWSAPVRTSLNGAWIDLESAAT